MNKGREASKNKKDGLHTMKKGLKLLALMVCLAIVFQVSVFAISAPEKVSGIVTEDDMSAILSAINEANMQDGDSIIIGNSIIAICSVEKVVIPSGIRGGNSVILTHTVEGYELNKLVPVFRIQLCANYYYDGTYVEMYTPSHTFGALVTGYSGTVDTLVWTIGQKTKSAEAHVCYQVKKSGFFFCLADCTVTAYPNGTYDTAAHVYQ